MIFVVAASTVTAWVVSGYLIGIFAVVLTFVVMRRVHGQEHAV